MTTVSQGRSIVTAVTSRGLSLRCLSRKTIPYRGLGSGFPRVLAEKSQVEFIDSKEAIC